VNTPEDLWLGVARCAFGAAVVLVLQAVRTHSFGRRPPLAPAAAGARRGILYAFGAGMAPTAKESTRTHPGVWLLGMAYHLGIFTALGVLAWVILDGGPGRAPANAALSSALLVVDTLLVAGALGGLGLLARRAGSPVLRGLSHPDDYVANLLTTVFIALAAVRMWSPRLEPVLLVAAMALFCYMPVGKIRHCVFFFLSRYHLGRHYGRRGTFPLRH
jgi:hypothetical protein